MQRYLAAYVDAFDYGNEDVSGDKGKGNGLTNAWLSSSLQISPMEQVGFLTRMIEGRLPVSAAAAAYAKDLMDNGEQGGGWHVYGKTGAGMPFGPDGALLEGQPFGWYVGWAERGAQRIVFARLIRFSDRPNGSPGAIAREGVMRELFTADGPTPFCVSRHCRGYLVDLLLPGTDNPEDFTGDVSFDHPDGFEL